MFDDFDRFDDPIYAAVRLEWAVAEVERALKMAEIRALPVAELLDRIPNLLDDDDREQIIYHLNEVEFDREEAAAFARITETVAGEWERLPSREKTRADAILARLIRRLPEPHRCRQALALLSHRRKRRREGAYKTLRDSGIPTDAIGDVLGLADVSPDQQLLELIARNPSAVAQADEHYLLENIEESYWRMRVVEALLRVAPERAIALGANYPIQLVHAIGRLAAREHLPVIRELFVEHRSDPHFLSIYAWALGRIGDQHDLKHVRSALGDLRKQLPGSDA